MGRTPGSQSNFSGMPSFEPLNKGTYHGCFPVNLVNEEDPVRYPSNKNVFVKGIIRSGAQAAERGSLLSFFEN